MKIIPRSPGQISNARRANALYRQISADPRFTVQARAMLLVGSEAILKLAARFDTTGVSSGVKAGTASCQAICNRLGQTQSDFIYAQATDPDLLGCGHATR